MPLHKIKQANKKYRHEQRRKAKRQLIKKGKQKDVVRRKRMRKMFIQGRQEYLAKRKSEKNYIDSLESELTKQ